MANEYAVNQADLQAVADAIRTKGGTSDALTFPGGFVDAVGAIQAGGGGDDNTLFQVLEGTIERLESCVGVIADYKFYNCKALTEVFLPDASKIGGNAFSGCNSLSTVSAPALQSVGGNAFANTIITELYLPSINGINGGAFSSCKNLQKIVLGPAKELPFSAFNNCSALRTIVMNSDSVVRMAASNALSNTPFASGGEGGTIYIPKVLYDELGTGSSLDYKVQTNWAAYDAYGTITWAQIEGSEYE